MRIAAQTSADRLQLSELIKAMGVAMLTTLADDGTLMSRPMSPLEMDGSGALWFFTDTRSAKLERSGVVNLAFTDPSRSTYVSISGRGFVFLTASKSRSCGRRLPYPGSLMGRIPSIWLC